MNIDSYKFSCNGGRVYNAEEMMEVGTSNALIQVVSVKQSNSMGSTQHIGLGFALENQL